jgi:uncharacterized SAM-dependent methyltransferase
MRLISLHKQTVGFNGASIELDADEYIVTEHSHKYSPERFADMARQAGFEPRRAWNDQDNLFSVRYLVATGS